jgi:hypothetical protein
MCKYAPQVPAPAVLQGERLQWQRFGTRAVAATYVLVKSSSAN